MASDPWAEFQDADTTSDPWAEFQDAPQGESEPSTLGKVFPSTTSAVKEHDGGMISDANVAFGALSDVSSILQRGLAAAFSEQKFSDPNAYLGRESVEESGREADARREAFREIHGENPQETLRRMQREKVSGMPSGSTAPVREFATRALTDPSSYAGGLSTTARGVQRVGKGVKSMGPEILRRSVKPSRPSMRAWNPPDFEVPLERGLVPKFGGIEKAGQNIQKAVEGASGAKEAALVGANVRLNGSASVQRARKAALSGVARKGGLSVEQAKDIPKYMNEAFENAKSYSSFRGNRGGWSLSGEDALEYRKFLDDQIKAGKGFGQTEYPAARTKFFQELRRDFESQLETRVGHTGQGAAYSASKKDLAELVPIQKAFAYRLEQEPNNYALGLRETMLLGGAVASGNTAAATAKAGIGVAINRLLNRPGGAAILYDLGRNMSEPGPMKNLLIHVGETGKVSSVVNRVVQALATETDENKKAILERKLDEQITREARK